MIPPNQLLGATFWEVGTSPDLSAFPSLRVDSRYLMLQQQPPSRGCPFPAPHPWPQTCVARSQPAAITVAGTGLSQCLGGGDEGVDGEGVEAAWHCVSAWHGVPQHGCRLGSRESTGVGTGLCLPSSEAGEGSSSWGAGLTGIELVVECSR